MSQRRITRSSVQSNEVRFLFLGDVQQFHILITYTLNRLMPRIFIGNKHKNGITTHVMQILLGNNKNMKLSTGVAKFCLSKKYYYKSSFFSPNIKGNSCVVDSL